MHHQTDRYVRPGSGDHVMNRIVRWLARRGVSLAGTRELRIVGRTSGQVRSNVVNLLELDGRRYLFSPRGHTQWVRNLRAAGIGELRVGREVEAFRATELDDQAKAPVIREYLRRWGWEVSRLVEGLTEDATDEELAAAAPDFPVFEVHGD